MGFVNYDLELKVSLAQERLRYAEAARDLDHIEQDIAFAKGEIKSFSSTGGIDLIDGTDNAFDWNKSLAADELRKSRALGELRNAERAIQRIELRIAHNQEAAMGVDPAVMDAEYGPRVG